MEMAYAANLTMDSLLPSISSKTASKTSQTTKPSSTRSQPHLTKVSELLKKDESLWTVYSCTQNLPAALNDPNNREVDLFTKTWGETFVPLISTTSLDLYPKINRSDFVRYLKDSRKKKRHHKTSSPDPASQVNTATTVWQDGQDYDIALVPKIFMQPSFNLNNSATFTEVLPGMFNSSAGEQRRRSSSDDKSTTFQSAQLLHEKLVHYLDIVEVHLAYHVSRKSDVFFSTLTSQQDLQDQISETREQVSSLRKKLGGFDKLANHGLLQAVKLHSTKSRYIKIYHKLKLMATVAQTQPTIQLLLNTSDFVGALDLINTTRDVLQLELSGIHCLRHLGSELVEIENAIERMMENDFVNFLMEGVKQRVDSQEKLSDQDEQTTEEKMISAVIGLLRQKKTRFIVAVREKLSSFIHEYVKQTLSSFLPEQVTASGSTQSNAERIRALDFSKWLEVLGQLFQAMLKLLQAVQSIVKLIINVCQVASSDSAITVSEVSLALEDTQSSDCIAFKRSDSSVISQEVDELSGAETSSQAIEHFERTAEEQDAQDRVDQLLLEDELSDARIAEQGSKEQTASVGELLDQNSTTSVQHSVSSGSSEAIITKTGSQIISVSASQSLIESCRDLLCGCCELIHMRCVKILNVRAKAGKLSNLASGDFMLMVKLIEKFVNNCASITGREHPNLRAPLLSQGKKFLENFHEARKGNLTLLLDGERWKQVDVPPEIQSIVERFETNSLSSSSSHTFAEFRADSSPKEHLIVKGQQFAVVGTLLILIRVITEYCNCADDLPMLTTDILSKLINLLKFFNTRTSQLVLGGGAVQAVVIKTITTRHLAMTSRCLQVIMLLLPDISRFFQERLTSHQSILLTQFNQITEDFSSHCREISNKLVVIIDDVIQKQFVRWEAKAPSPSPSFKIIVKQMTKLHEALVDLLPPEQLQAVFNGIEDNIKERFKVVLNKAKITNNGSPQHGFVNSELTMLKGAINSLDGLKNFGNNLFDIWTPNR